MAKWRMQWQQIWFYFFCYLFYFLSLASNIFNAKFHSYILVVYSNCLFQHLQFIFFFCKQLDVYWVVNLFLRFYKFVSHNTLLLLLLLFTAFRVFHTSVSRWFLTGVWVTASLLKSLGPSSVFWPILIMLLFGWSPPVFSFPSLPVLVPILLWLYQVHQL